MSSWKDADFLEVTHDGWCVFPLLHVQPCMLCHQFPHQNQNLQYGMPVAMCPNLSVYFLRVSNWMKLSIFSSVILGIYFCAFPVWLCLSAGPHSLSLSLSLLSFLWSLSFLLLSICPSLGLYVYLSPLSLSHKNSLSLSLSLLRLKTCCNTYVHTFHRYCPGQIEKCLTL